MRISWKITKKRGNYRPVLAYRILLEPFEQELAVPAVEIQSRIPRPPVAFETHCWPGENERTRNWQAEECYVLKTPSHKEVEVEAECRLPWRADNAYPEVEESFDLIRQAYEQVLQAAYDSLPMDRIEELSYTSEMKKHLAPGVAARRLIQPSRKP